VSGPRKRGLASSLREHRGEVTLRYFTDPGCPPDPARMRLRWLYGDRLAWELCMIVLREERGPGWPQARGSDATVHACRAVVGTRLRWPERAEAILRHLQVLAGAGEPLDDSDTLEVAAERAGLPVDELAAYCAEPEVETELRADMEAAAGRACGTKEVTGELGRLERRGEARSVGEVLAWAGMPLATSELAAICGREVRADLARIPQLDGGYWSL
jgi:hypothetical protein